VVLLVLAMLPARTEVSLTTLARLTPGMENIETFRDQRQASLQADQVGVGEAR
jgi:hypothetical protein